MERSEPLFSLDEGLQDSPLSSSDGSVYLSSLGDDEWDPEVLLEAMGDDIGDFGEVAIAEPRKKKKKLNYDPNKARNERRFVLIQLRGEVEKLQTRLKQLQRIRGENKKPNDQHEDSRSRPSNKNADMPEVWKEICFRQLDRRLRAEQENVHLKESCEREMQVVKSIKRLLYRQSPPSHMVYLEGTTHTRRIEIPTARFKHMAALIFEQLSSGVEDSYRHAEAVVEVNNPVSTGEMTPKPLLRNIMNGARLELFDHRILPFDMRMTGDAWWQYWNNYRGRRVQETADNVVTESFGLEFCDATAGTTATFYVQQILRRHVEEGRTVIVWNAYVEPFTFENERVSDVYFLMRSHVIIRPGDRASVDCGDADTASTRMSTCEIITPHFLNPGLKDEPEMVALTGFVASSLSSNIMMRNEKIEDLLLDQTLEQRSKAN
ncbi:ABC Superfamily [Phytophthora cinnamomi]|uniref:ABC Superfamily n=1 Tax=Phytophthora cinnamomi TaxID=4785 RepID=UPI002A2F6DF7|nr:ABC Superfamily [Phytophthora cinnamomi]KAJ8564329.1 hypothetical protein ON010_g7016 [Phytophthora cinnamomi]